MAALRDSNISAPADLTLAGYYGAGTPGGGTLHYDPGDTTSIDNGCTVFWDKAGHRFKRPAGPLSVLACGAKGDGVTNDTAAQIAALSASPVAGTVTWPNTAGCYVTTSTLIIAKSLTLTGSGTICGKTQNIDLFSITASNVNVDGLTLTGPQFATYHGKENAIYATGVFHPGGTPTNIKNFVAKNLNISGFGAAAIQANYVDGLDITHNKIQNLPYAGIVVLSGTHGTVNYNSVANISGTGSPGLNAYGIAISRETGDSGELTSQPRSAYMVVKGNTVDNVPTWAGLDTHSGSHITFTDNKVTNTFFGISVGGSRNSAGVKYTYAPLDIVVSGNSLNSMVTDGIRGTGISFTGTPVQNATGSITGNTVTGYGTSTTAADGAILAYHTEGLAITGNTIRDPSPNGLALITGNRGMTISGNIITDPFTNAVAVGGAQGILIAGDSNTLVINNNIIMHADKTATYLLNTASGAAVRLGPGAGNSVSIGRNKTNATFPIINTGGSAIISLHSAKSNTH